MSKLSKEELGSLKRYIDNHLQRFLTLPIDIFCAIVRNFPTDYDLDEMAKMLNLRSSPVNNFEKVIEDSNIDLFVDVMTRNNHPDLGYFWDLISKTYAEFSQPVIEKYSDKFDWNVISSLNPTQEFIEQNFDRINWSLNPCSEKKLPFFEKYENDINFDKVDWGTLEWDVIEKYITKIKEVKFKTKDEEKGMSYGQCATDFIERYQEYVPIKTYMEVLSDTMDNIPQDWDALSQYFQLDNEFLDDMSHRVNWELVSQCQNMSLNLMLKYMNEVNDAALLKNVKISNDIKEEFLTRKGIEAQNSQEEEIEEIEEEEVEETEEAQEEGESCSADGGCLCDCGEVEDPNDSDDPALKVALIFTNEEKNKEIKYSFDFTDGNMHKVRDFYQLMEAIQVTHEELKAENKKRNGDLLEITYVMKFVEIDTLKADIDEFLEERGYKNY